MATGDDLFSPEDVRSSMRRRWFERVVMLPVAIGMVSATAGFITKDVLNAIAGSGMVVLNHIGMPLGIVSSLLAVGTFIISFIRWRLR